MQTKLMHTTLGPPEVYLLLPDLALCTPAPSSLWRKELVGETEGGLNLFLASESAQRKTSTDQIPTADKGLTHKVKQNRPQVPGSGNIERELGVDCRLSAAFHKFPGSLWLGYPITTSGGVQRGGPVFYST